jgi:hypothetical protein
MNLRLQPTRQVEKRPTFVGVTVHPAVERPLTGAFRTAGSGQAPLRHPEHTA